MFVDQHIDCITGQEGEDADPLFSIRIAGIEPELVKLIGGGPNRIKPDIATFCFTEFSAICFCDQGVGKYKGFTTAFTTDQFCTGGHIPPLVAATHLEFTVFMLVQPVKIIALH